MASYYDILGVSKDASDKEIRQAYRRLARKYHPDLNSGDKEAEEQFKKINESYEVLSDQGKRKKYDMYGDQWKHADQIESQFGTGAGAPVDWSFRRGEPGDTLGADLFGGWEDLRSGFGLGSGRQGRTTTATHMQSQVSVTLEEALAGAKRLVTISRPSGGRRIEVSIPPGVDTGSTVRIRLGRGRDLFINVTVLPHPGFQRKGADLYTEVEVPLADAILGGEVAVKTLKGKVKMKVPAESQNGQRIRLSGQGMPTLGKPDVKGDLFVTLRPRLPKKLTEEERDLVRKLRETREQKG